MITAGKAKMFILFKYEAKKYAYDSASGALIPLSALQHKVAENIDFPMPPLCPTALRYQLAKYDAGDVRQAYAYLYGLYSRGIIGGETDGAALLLEGELSIPTQELAQALMSELMSAGVTADKIRILGNCDFADKLK